MKQGLFWLGLSGLLITRVAFAWAPADQHDIALMEQRLFNQVYDKEAPATRVNRVENAVYGVTKTGVPEARISALRKVLVPPTSTPESTPARSPANSPMVSNGSYVPTGVPTGNLPRQSPPATPSTPSAAMQKATSESDYPIVDELERRVLTQTFPKDDLTVRVPRLEARVFGQPQQGDWSNRVDALHDKVIGRGKAVPNPNDDPDTAISTGDDSPEFNVSPEQVQPAVTRMEQQLFRQTYPNEPVESRLGRIENKLFSKTAPPEMSPEERLERIIAVSGAGGQRPAQTRSTAANIAIQLAPILIMMLPLVI